MQNILALLTGTAFSLSLMNAWRISKLDRENEKLRKALRTLVAIRGSKAADYASLLEGEAP
jgi:hypothetical protein